MIENYITHNRIIQGEPALEDYLRRDTDSFQSIIDEAFDEYLCDMKDRQVDLKKLGVHLPIPKDGVSEEDTIERRRVVVYANDEGFLVLQGSNTKDGTFIDIKNLDIPSEGKFDFIFSALFKFYKIRYESGDISDWSAYLYETTFDYPLLYLMRSKIYLSLYNRNGDDAFKEKAEYYRNEYLQKVADKPASHYYYDFDGDGKVTNYEASKPSVHKITIRP